MVINIPDQALNSAKISSEELLLDFAIYLYEKEILSIGQARKMVEMDLISFQKALSKRDVFIHFDVSDLEKDLANLELL
jgi:predicted HTH domain antitoxin